MNQESAITILAVSGSLRATSSNTLLLQYIGKLFEPGVNFRLYQGIASIPAFDDATTPPEAVEDWKQEIKRADGMIICSPEYAFGIPGALKNAFDWTVGSGDMVAKPLALITAATGGEKAHASWLSIFTALSAHIPAGCAINIPYVRSKMDASGNLTDANTKLQLSALIHSLINHIQTEKFHQA